MLETLNRIWFLSINAQPGTPEGIITFARFCANGTIFLFQCCYFGYGSLLGKQGVGRLCFVH
ncbi:hypothetical protein PCO82_17740 [Pectobacteriaceae bacterium CE90]|nr:hypothetical protein PCO82_17740 [Pectobacteriaceae bacterium CE90]